jgi:hypothetical protein
VRRHPHHTNSPDTALMATLGANPALYQLDVTNGPPQKRTPFPLLPLMARPEIALFTDDDARFLWLCHCGPRLSGPCRSSLYHKYEKSPIDAFIHVKCAITQNDGIIRW